MPVRETCNPVNPTPPKAATGRKAPMDLQLTSKKALVTGSTAGIGFAIASLLPQEGASVVVNGRCPRPGEQAPHPRRAGRPAHSSGHEKRPGDGGTGGPRHEGRCEPADPRPAGGGRPGEQPRHL